MQITIVKVGNVDTIPTGKGRPYKRLEVLYRLSNGNQGTKKLVSFKNPLVFKQMSEAQEGQVFEVESVKSEDGQYTEWKSANLVGDANGEEPAAELPKTTTTTAAAVKAPVKMTVTEVDRQRSIVRQSSLERAIQFLVAQGQAFSEAEVKAVAAGFEQWVQRPSVEDVLTQANINPIAKKAPGRPRKVIPVPQTAAEVSDDDIPTDAFVNEVD
jgi:hypothetical protein